jgi:hypothetical protein
MNDMSFALWVLTFSGLLLLLGVPPLRASWRRQGAWALVDVALLIVPVTIYVQVLLMRARSSNEQIAWGLLGFPWFIQIVSLISVCLSVYIPAIAWLPNRTARSLIFLIAESVLALVWATHM